MQINLTIPAPYNGGEWRISKLVAGPRGGTRWTKIISQPATGGTYHTDLETGQYKQTYWTNGVARSTTFEITSDEQLIWHSEDF